MGAYEEFKHMGMSIKLIADTDPELPEQDEGLFIVTTRNRHFQLLSPDDRDAGQCMADKVFCKQYWVFPLLAYIHGGVALSLIGGGQFSDRWDAGQIGFVFVSRGEFRYRMRERKRCVSARTAAKHYIESWNQYLSGDVWGYAITDEEGEDVDSCWGFYGLNYCRDEAKARAEWFARDAAEKVAASPGDVPMARQ